MPNGTFLPSVLSDFDQLCSDAERRGTSDKHIRHHSFGELNDPMESDETYQASGRLPGTALSSTKATVDSSSCCSELEYATGAADGCAGTAGETTERVLSDLSTSAYRLKPTVGWADDSSAVLAAQWWDYSVFSEHVIDSMLPMMEAEWTNCGLSAIGEQSVTSQFSLLHEVDCDSERQVAVEPLGMPKQAPTPTTATELTDDTAALVVAEVLSSVAAAILATGTPEQSGAAPCLHRGYDPLATNAVAVALLNVAQSVIALPSRGSTRVQHATVSEQQSGRARPSSARPTGRPDPHHYRHEKANAGAEPNILSAHALNMPHPSSPCKAGLSEDGCLSDISVGTPSDTPPPGQSPKDANARELRLRSVRKKNKIGAERA